MSTRTREAGNESAAALFDRMVIEEKEHERLLLEWMARESIDANPGIGPISWRDPGVSTTYDDEARNPHHSTPYKALAFAVHNEEYDAIVESTADEATMVAAQRLTASALDRIGMLKQASTDAYKSAET